MPGTVTLYNRRTKEKVTMYAIQARETLRDHGDEWTQSPVPGAFERAATAPTVDPKTGEAIPAGERGKQKHIDKSGESGAPKVEGPRSSSRQQQLRGEVDLSGGGESEDEDDDQAEGEEGDEPDDFTKISGIGAATAEKLEDAGITSYAQLRDMTPQQIAAVEEKLGQHGVFERNNWVKQAKDLAG